ncbi:MAG: hypothetical protein M3N30_02895, partial [Bacteroidota bacterium]|nr:hypothetical protein [Bacteroidota bacterium]
EVMAPRLFISCFVGSKNENGLIQEDVPYLKQQYPDLSPEQLLGCEDVRRAEEIVNLERKRLAKNKNKQKYYDYLQDNPLNEKEAFLRFNSNEFDKELLNDQRFEIANLITPKYRKYKLEWLMNTDGSVKLPLAVKAVPAKDEDPEEECVLIHRHPLVGHRNLDVAGIDSYDMDVSATSKSLGGMVVLRRDNTIADEVKKAPICLIRNRPKRKELFYEMCMKASVYYNLLGNTLVDAANPLIIQYFIDRGCKKYLAVRPKSIESENSEQGHKYGVKLTVHSKPIMVSMLQTYVLDHIHKVWYPDIIDEFSNYDVTQKDSDWDAVDALGIALIRDMDMKKKFSDQETAEYEDKYEMPVWKSDGQGNLSDMTVVKKLSDATDPFIRNLEQGVYR